MTEDDMAGEVAATRAKLTKRGRGVPVENIQEVLRVGGSVTLTAEDVAELEAGIRDAVAEVRKGLELPEGTYVIDRSAGAVFALDWRPSKAAQVEIEAVLRRHRLREVGGAVIGKGGRVATTKAFKGVSFRGVFLGSDELRNAQGKSKRWTPADGPLSGSGGAKVWS